VLARRGTSGVRQREARCPPPFPWGAGPCRGTPTSECRRPPGPARRPSLKRAGRRSPGGTDLVRVVGRRRTGHTSRPEEEQIRAVLRHCPVLNAQPRRPVRPHRGLRRHRRLCECRPRRHGRGDRLALLAAVRQPVHLCRPAGRGAWGAVSGAADARRFFGGAAVHGGHECAGDDLHDGDGRASADGPDAGGAARGVPTRAVADPRDSAPGGVRGGHGPRSGGVRAAGGVRPARPVFRRPWGTRVFLQLRRGRPHRPE